MNIAVRVIGLCSIAAALAAAQAGHAAEPGWPQFRGPGGAGVADESSLPERWSTTENVAWVVEVPGRGWSSPIVLARRVFVTSAVSPGAFKAPSTGIFGNDYAAELAKQGLSDDEVVKRVVARDIELTSETGEISYMVYALDREDRQGPLGAGSAQGARRSAAAIARTPTRRRRR